MDLMMSDFDVRLIDDSMQQFHVIFHGPDDTPYAGGVWKLRVELPDLYPIRLPLIGFVNRIFHPNVDEISGSVCLDVINQTWSPMFGLLNIFENFLPHLLRYANPTDPLNNEASRLMTKDEDSYTETIKKYVQKYALKKIAPEDDDEEMAENEDDELSDVGSLSSDDDDDEGL